MMTAATIGTRFVWRINFEWYRHINSVRTIINNFPR